MKGELIGKGEFGDVYKINLNGEFYAVKNIIPPTDSQKSTKNILPSDFIIEIDSYKRLNHPNVLKLIKFTIKNDNYYLTFELGEMNLHELIFTSKKNYNVREIAYQIVSGLLHILNQSLVTSDLKIKNIIVFKTGRIAILDFGISQINLCVAKSKHWINKNSYTINYRPPELLSGDNDHQIKHEISESWALGIVLYELENRIPFFWPNENDEEDMWIPLDYEKETIDKLYKRIHNTLRYQWDANYKRKIFYSKDFILDNLIEKLLQFNPENRLSVGQAMYHIYFDRVNLNQTYLKPLEEIFDCERKLMNQQYTQHLFNSKANLKDYIEQNIKFFIDILSIVKSVRILSISFQILYRYYNPSLTLNVRFDILFYVIILLTIKFLDRNTLFSNLYTKIEGIINKLTTFEDIKRIMYDVYNRLDGRIAYTSPIDFLDYYLDFKKKNIFLEVQKIIYVIFLFNGPLKYDSKTIALCAIKQYYEINGLIYRVPNDKKEEVLSLQSQIIHTDFYNLYNKLKPIVLVD